MKKDNERERQTEGLQGEKKKGAKSERSQPSRIFVLNGPRCLELCWRRPCLTRTTQDEEKRTLLITHKKQHGDMCTRTHSHSISSNIFKFGDPCSLQSSRSAGHNGTIQGKWSKEIEVRILLRGRWRSGVLSGVHRGVVVAFMVITSQHPIVSGLSGRSDLGAEVVAFCTLADKTYCHIQ